MGSASCESETFEANAEVTLEKVFYIKTPAPGVIAAEKTIVATEDSFIISHLPLGASAFGFGESVSTPDAHVPFLVPVPFRAGNRLHLFHFLPGVSLSPGNGNGNDTKKDD